MSYNLRITSEHPAGPFFTLFLDGQRIASGRVNRRHIAELVVMFFKLTRPPMKPATWAQPIQTGDQRSPE